MRESPFAFLRGSAALFYDVLTERRELRRGPPGRGWIVGDAHLENFGAFRPGSLQNEETEEGSHAPQDAVFDLNDFDETVVGPLRYDVLRLSTSLVLAARERGIDAPQTLKSAAAFIQAHAQRLFEPRSRMPAQPQIVGKLLQTVKERKRTDLLDGRTCVIDGRRQFVRGDRYLEVPPRLWKRAEDGFARFGARLPGSDRLTEEQSRVVDIAFRVAGSGSLGGLRLAVLVAGKGGRDGVWMFEMKEQGIAAAAVLVGENGQARAKRVIEGMRACLQRPPRFLGTAKVGDKSMLVRRLSPQEDKVNPKELTKDAIESFAAYCGALLANAHRRGMKKVPRGIWKRADLDSILEAAVRLAAIHEAAWFAYFDIQR